MDHLGTGKNVDVPVIGTEKNVHVSVMNRKYFKLCPSWIRLRMFLKNIDKGVFRRFTTDVVGFRTLGFVLKSSVKCTCNENSPS